MPEPRNSARLTRTRLILLAILVAVGGPWTSTGRADDPPPSRAFLDFVRSAGAALRAGDAPPKTVLAWEDRADALRRGLLDAWGGFPSEPCPLDAKVLGTMKRDGYRVEKVIFQTRPGVLMTANAYVPDAPGKHPAILMVHGHWAGAKQDPVVQARCLGAVKLGFFVLAVDAFGAGERGVGKALGEYHGAMTAATLLPVGLPLSGLQVYENLRAVDYLRTRPEVDAENIGITGASGGGNQAMYAGAWDHRLKAIVPVCSVGNFGAYLGTGCCLCEVVPGGLWFTDEWAVLGAIAPRALMVVSASRDAVQFSVPEARKSLALAEPIFRLYDKSGHVRHAVFESGHDYSRPMREAMYGWMTLHLKGEGDGSPFPEPAFQTENPETLRCYPGDTRPDDFITIPRFAATEGRKLVAAKAPPKDADAWRTEAEIRKRALVQWVFGGLPRASRLATRKGGGLGPFFLNIESEPGIWLRAQPWPHGRPVSLFDRNRDSSRLAIFIDHGDEGAKAFGDRVTKFRRAGWSICQFSLRATGETAWPSDRVGQAPDHNSAEWALWLGRPMLGQWAFDVSRVLDAVEEFHGRRLSEVVVVGRRRAGLVALCAGAVDPRVTKVVAIDALTSYVSDRPYKGHSLGEMAPGILREVGDVPQIAALIAPRKVVIAGGVAGDGEILPLPKLRDAYRDARQVWDLLGAGDALSVLDSADTDGMVNALGR